MLRIGNRDRLMRGVKSLILTQLEIAIRTLFICCMMPNQGFMDVMFSF